MFGLSSIQSRSLAVMQVALWFIARVLRRPLTPSVIAAGLLLPHAVLAPWILNNSLLLPTVHVQRAFPGSPRVETESRHAKLNDTVYQLVPWELEVRRAFAERLCRNRPEGIALLDGVERRLALAASHVIFDFCYDDVIS